MYKTLNEEKKELARKLVILFILVAALLTIGTLVYHYTENWSYRDALYFSTMSLTSRGFSNLYPVHWFSVLFSIVYLLIGVGVIIYTISSFIAYYTAYYQKRVEQKFRYVIEGFGKDKKPKEEKWIMIKPPNGGI